MADFAERLSEDDAARGTAAVLLLVELVPLDMLVGCEPGTEDDGADAADAAARMLSMAWPLSSVVLGGRDSSADEDLAIVLGMCEVGWS